MYIKLIILAAVFTGVYFLVNSLYPLLENGINNWRKKRIEAISPKLNEAFIDISFKRLMLIDVLCPLASGSAGYIITRSFLIAAGSAIFGLAIPFLIMRRLTAIRRQKFTSQLVDGLMIISSSLKAGLSLLQSFEVLIEEMPAPISQEFGLVVRQMQMGIQLDEAMGSLRKRMQVEELDLIVTAMTVARETGGDFTETLSRVIVTITERNKLIGRVNALCVQAKLQGIIMSVLPIAFGLFIYKMDPRFFDVFFQDNFGKMLLVYAGVSEMLGIFFIYKLSKIDF